MEPVDPRSLIRDRTLDAGTQALLWLLSDGGVPTIVAGPAPVAVRRSLASALVAVDPARPWIVLDADEETLDAARLAALLRGGSALGVTVAGSDLEEVLEHLVGQGLPEDGVRRLGVVVIADETSVGLRCTVVHYLRPTERDAQRHVQRRPPAILAAWDEQSDSFEDYGWGITPELADRVDRSQADLEERQSDRARFLASLQPDDDYGARVHGFLASEPPRIPAPPHETAEPSPLAGGLTDPDPHPHEH